MAQLPFVARQCCLDTWKLIAEFFTYVPVHAGRTCLHQSCARDAEGRRSAPKARSESDRKVIYRYQGRLADSLWYIL